MLGLCWKAGVLSSTSPQRSFQRVACSSWPPVKKLRDCISASTVAVTDDVQDMRARRAAPPRPSCATVRRYCRALTDLLIWRVYRSRLPLEFLNFPAALFPWYMWRSQCVLSVLSSITRRLVTRRNSSVYDEVVLSFDELAGYPCS